MKGIVFTEFLEMVDDMYGIDMSERLVEECDLPSKGAYTAVGTYDHREMLQLVAALSKQCHTDIGTLCRLYGRHLFGRFTHLYTGFFDGHRSAFSFLETVENHIHTEVLKLYEDARPPSITCHASGPLRMVVTYRSHRCLSPVCHGLIEGCIDHFGDPMTVTMEDLGNGREGHALFTLVRNAG